MKRSRLRNSGEVDDDISKASSLQSQIFALQHALKEQQATIEQLQNETASRSELDAAMSLKANEQRMLTFFRETENNLKHAKNDMEAFVKSTLEEQARQKASSRKMEFEALKPIVLSLVKIEMDARLDCQLKNSIAELEHKVMNHFEAVIDLDPEYRADMQTVAKLGHRVKAMLTTISKLKDEIHSNHDTRVEEQFQVACARCEQLLDKFKDDCKQVLEDSVEVMKDHQENMSDVAKNIEDVIQNEAKQVRTSMKEVGYARLKEYESKITQKYKQHLGDVVESVDASAKQCGEYAKDIKKFSGSMGSLEALVKGQRKGMEEATRVAANNAVELQRSLEATQNFVRMQKETSLTLTNQQIEMDKMWKIVRSFGTMGAGTIKSISSDVLKLQQKVQVIEESALGELKSRLNTASKDNKDRLRAMEKAISQSQSELQSHIANQLTKAGTKLNGKIETVKKALLSELHQQTKVEQESNQSAIRKLRGQLQKHEQELVSLLAAEREYASANINRGFVELDKKHSKRLMLIENSIGALEKSRDELLASKSNRGSVSQPAASPTARRKTTIAVKQNSSKTRVVASTKRKAKSIVIANNESSSSAANIERTKQVDDELSSYKDSNQLGTEKSAISQKENSTTKEQQSPRTSRSNSPGPCTAFSDGFGTNSHATSPMVAQETVESDVILRVELLEYLVRDLQTGQTSQDTGPLQDPLASAFQFSDKDASTKTTARSHRRSRRKPHIPEPLESPAGEHPQGTGQTDSTVDPETEKLPSARPKTSSLQTEVEQLEKRARTMSLFSVGALTENQIEFERYLEDAERELGQQLEELQVVNDNNINTESTPVGESYSEQQLNFDQGPSTSDNLNVRLMGNLSREIQVKLGLLEVMKSAIETKVEKIDGKLNLLTRQFCHSQGKQQGEHADNSEMVLWDPELFSGGSPVDEDQLQDIRLHQQKLGERVTHVETVYGSLDEWKQVLQQEIREEVLLGVGQELEAKFDGDILNLRQDMANAWVKLGSVSTTLNTLADSSIRSADTNEGTPPFVGTSQTHRMRPSVQRESFTRIDTDDYEAIKTISSTTTHPSSNSIASRKGISSAKPRRSRSATVRSVADKATPSAVTSDPIAEEPVMIGVAQNNETNTVAKSNRMKYNSNTSCAGCLEHAGELSELKSITHIIGSRQNKELNMINAKLNLLSGFASVKEKVDEMESVLKRFTRLERMLGPLAKIEADFLSVKAENELLCSELEKVGVPDHTGKLGVIMDVSRPPLSGYSKSPKRKGQQQQHGNRKQNLNTVSMKESSLPDNGSSEIDEDEESAGTGLHGKIRHTRSKRMTFAALESSSEESEYSGEEEAHKLKPKSILKSKTTTKSRNRNAKKLFKSKDFASTADADQLERNAAAVQTLSSAKSRKSRELSKSAIVTQESKVNQAETGIKSNDADASVLKRNSIDQSPKVDHDQLKRDIELLRAELGLGEGGSQQDSAASSGSEAI